VDGEAQEEGVRYLPVAVQAPGERLGEGVPVGGNGLIAVAGLLFQAVEHRGCLAQRQLAGLGSSEEAEDAGLGEWAEGPLQATSVKPLSGGAVVDMCFVEESDEGVDVEEMSRALSQGLPPRAGGPAQG